MLALQIQLPADKTARHFLMWHRARALVVAISISIKSEVKLTWANRASARACLSIRTPSIQIRGTVLSQDTVQIRIRVSFVTIMKTVLQLYWISWNQNRRITKVNSGQSAPFSAYTMVMVEQYALISFETTYINSSLRMKTFLKIRSRRWEMDSEKLKDYLWSLQKVRKKRQVR